MPTVKKIKPFFTDARGKMYHLIEGDTSFNSAVLITCKKGAIRANHYHKKDAHYSYMLEGGMNYYYTSDEKKKPKKVVVHKGEIVYTPPGEIHAMEFTQDSIFIAITTEERSMDKYEEDTIRIKIV